MGSRCSCPPGSLGDPDCREHGLRDDQPFPPMDRHALPGEDAKQTQWRLYRESRGLKECESCGRVGRRGFVVGRTFEGRTEHYWKCEAKAACADRGARRLRAVAKTMSQERQARERVKRLRREQAEDRKLRRDLGA